MRSRISVRLSPVAVMPWLRRPITACVGIRLAVDQVGDGLGELLGAARVVDVRRGDALHPGVDVEDRADVGVRLVDHPVLDRVDGDAARLDPRRHADDHLRVRLVVAVTSRMSRPATSSCDLSTPLALIQKRVSSLRAERLPYESPPTW